MQLTLAVTLVLGCALASSARAQDDDERRGTASVTVYADDDHMTVVSPRAGAQAPVATDWLLEVSLGADVVSGASVDVVSEASPSAIDETRVEGSLGVSARLTRRSTMRVRSIVSHENDYLSLGGELGATLELAQRNTSLDLGLVGSRDTVGAVTVPGLEETRDRLRLTATLTQVVDRVTYVDLAAAFMRDAGYLENPYRTVPIIDPDAPLVMRVAERVPGRRRAGAVRARARRAIAPGWFARASYRYYLDDWAVDSHTGELAVMSAVMPRLRVGVDLRLYHQSAARFYRDRYQLTDGALPDERTRERRLGRMRSGRAGVTADLALRPSAPAGARLVTAIGLWRFAWPDNVAQRGRNAIVLTVGLDTPF